MKHFVAIFNRRRRRVFTTTCPFDLAPVTSMCVHAQPLEKPMSRAVTVLAIVFALVMAALPATAAEFGTRDEATAMVRRVQQKFKKEGAEAAFRAINNKAPGFADRDLYPFVTELTGLCVANGVTPAVRGKNLLDLKDQDGKFMI